MTNIWSPDNASQDQPEMAGSSILSNLQKELKTLNLKMANDKPNIFKKNVYRLVFERM